MPQFFFFVVKYFAKVFCHLSSKTGISSASITQPYMQFPIGFVAAARGFEQARANTTFQQTIKGGVTEFKISSPPNRNAAKASAVKLTKARRLSETAISLITFDVICKCKESPHTLAHSLFCILQHLSLCLAASRNLSKHTETI